VPAAVIERGTELGSGYPVTARNPLKVKKILTCKLSALYSATSSYLHFQKQRMPAQLPMKLSLVVKPPHFCERMSPSSACGYSGYHKNKYQRNDLLRHPPI
jgi:hypothetical protein